MQTEPRKEAAIARLRTLTHVLDKAIPIPGTGFRIGLDPIIGLLPGGGDLISAILSVYIVWEAARLGAPTELVSKMVSNLVLDTMLGSVPMAGDFFDATWKANSKNLALLEAHLAIPKAHRKANPAIVIALLAGFLLFVLAIAAVTAFVVAALWKTITGG